MFYPNAKVIGSAKELVIGPGAEVGGINLTLNSQPLFHIRGKVIDARTGKAPSNAQVSVSGQTPMGGGGYGSGLYYNAATGAMDIGDIVPGTYTINVQTNDSLPAPPTITGGGGGGGGITRAGVGGGGVGGACTGPIARGPSGSTVITIADSDLKDVSITLGHTSLTGRLRIDGPAPTAQAARIQLVSGGDNNSGLSYLSDCPNDGGAFTLSNVLPGEYRLVMFGGGASYIREARLGGIDVLNLPLKYSGSGTETLDVVISSKVAQVSGVVRDDKLQPAAVIKVIVIPERIRWRADLYKQGTTDSEGHFTIRGIPPGDYKLFAWDALELNSWLDPEVVKPYEPKGAAIHLDEAGQATMDLRVIPVGGAQ